MALAMAGNPDMLKSRLIRPARYIVTFITALPCLLLLKLLVALLTCFEFGK